MRPGELVIVEWLDTQSKPDWQKPAAVPGCALCETVGRVVVDGDGVLKLAASRHKDAQDSEESVGDTVSIPWGCVKNIWRLEVV